MPGSTDHHIKLKWANEEDFGDCERILRQFPDWFGIEASIAAYTKDLTTSDVVVARQDGQVVGFLALRDHNPSTAKIHVMAVSPDAQRIGIGRALVLEAVERASASNTKLLEVKTLGPSHPDPFYAGTRMFYEAMGFIPLEELDELWSGNPCLIMVKVLAD